MNRLSAISLFAAVTLAFAAPACSESPVASPVDSSTGTASQFDSKLLKAPAGARVVDDSYIVVFKDDAFTEDAGPERAAHALSRQYADIDVDATFEHGLKGFSARIPEARLRMLLDDKRHQVVGVGQGCAGQHSLVEIERWDGPLPEISVLGPPELRA